MSIVARSKGSTVVTRSRITPISENECSRACLSYPLAPPFNGIVKCNHGFCQVLGVPICARPLPLMIHFFPVIPFSTHPRPKKELPTKFLACLNNVDFFAKGYLFLFDVIVLCLLRHSQPLSSFSVGSQPFHPALCPLLRGLSRLAATWVYSGCYHTNHLESRRKLLFHYQRIPFRDQKNISRSCPMPHFTVLGWSLSIVVCPRPIND